MLDVEVRPHGLPVLIERGHQHALRSADGSNRLQLSLSDAVVDRPPRNVEQCRGLIDGDAPPELLFEHLWTSACRATELRPAFVF